MIDHIDTAKEREWLKRLPLTISEVRHSHACDGGHSVVGGAAATAIARELTPRFDALLDALDTERARAEKAEAERDEWKDEYQTVERLLPRYKDAATNRQAERDQALASAAAAYELAAEVYWDGFPAWDTFSAAREAIRSLTPADAQDALDKMLDAAWNDAIEAAARVQDIAHQEGANAAGQHHAILALKRPEASHD